MRITKFLLLSVASMLIAICPASAASAGKTKAETPAKYIFFFIGDGMGLSQVSLAESYLSYKQGQFYSESTCFTQFPVFGTATTYSASSRVTDSSASGTALATGVKTTNGYLGVDPDNQPVYSYALDFQNMGYNIGIFSSVPVNHATPAAFYGHDKSRNSYWTITTQIPEAGYKFYGGSGFLQYDGPDHDKDSEAYLEEHGYQVVFGQAEFDAVKDTASKVVYLAQPRTKAIPNYQSTSEEVLNETVLLADMMSSAIDFLGDDQPFFIMCEGGEIDWECHANKVMPTVIAILKFNDAIKRAYEFYLAHPDDTLIVVTADHETGGLSLGNRKVGYNIYWNIIEEAWEKSHDLSDKSFNADLNERAGLGWTTGAHTGVPVPVYAIGKGAEKFSGRMDNSQFGAKFLCK